jgi:hypothetical protein
MLAIVAAVVAGMVVMVAVLGLLRGDEVARAPLVDRAPGPGSSALSTMPARVLSDRDPFSPPPALQAPTPSTGESLDDHPHDAISPEPTGTGSFTPPPTSTSPPTPPPTSTIPPTPPPDCGNARPSECRRVGSHVIVLLRVLGRHPRPSVDLEVDGDPVTNVRRGDRFAGGFKLVGFNDALCPRIVVGEEGFTLCEGERRS